MGWSKSRPKVDDWDENRDFIVLNLVLQNNNKNDEGIEIYRLTITSKLKRLI